MNEINYWRILCAYTQKMEKREILKLTLTWGRQAENRFSRTNAYETGENTLVWTNSKIDLKYSIVMKSSMFIVQVHARVHKWIGLLLYHFHWCLIWNSKNVGFNHKLGRNALEFEKNDSIYTFDKHSQQRHTLFEPLCASKRQSVRKCVLL